MFPVLCKSCKALSLCRAPQDKDSLYFVMDYIPGGDLMSLLIKFGIFEEPLARSVPLDVPAVVARRNLNHLPGKLPVDYSGTLLLLILKSQ